MFCVKCGNELPDGARFCNKCGASLAVDAGAGGENGTLLTSNGKDEKEAEKTGVEIIDKCYVRINSIIKKSKPEMRLKIGVSLAAVAGVISLFGQIDISTAWINVIAAAMIVYMYFTKKQSDQRLLSLAVTTFTARFLILDIVHIFGNENYSYQFSTVFIHLITYALAAVHWVYVAEKISYQMATVILAILYSIEIIFSLISAFTSFPKGFGVGMLYLGWCAFMMASAVTYTLHKEHVGDEFIDLVKTKLGINKN